MADTTPRVLFVNDLWGYGTATMAMTIAAELEGWATRLFAGMGPGFELARRADFEGLLPVDSMTEPVAKELDRLLGSCQAVVSVMNGPVARRAALRQIPCVYADCLLWMRPDPPDIPSGVAYFQERFPGAQEGVERWRDRLHQPEVVGPLVAHPTRDRPHEPDAVLVNFGGLSASLQEPSTLLAYAEVMTRCVLSALDRWPGRVVIAAGRHVLDGLDERGLRALLPRVELADLGHDAYLAELRRSRLLISSAGMHALYEAFSWGVPCVCLPSQNLSQVLALEALERHRVVRTLDWRHLYGLGGLQMADEAGACDRIGRQIRRFRGDAVSRAMLVCYLRSMLDDGRLAALQRRQARFFTGLGEPGAPRVAALVRELLEPRLCVRAGA